jgi:hypothetical protein
MMMLTMTTLADVRIGYEVSILPHIENDFDFNPDIQHKLILGKKYFSVFFAYVPNNQEISNKKSSEIINTMINYKRYSLTQTYFSDNLSFGIQVDPVNWFAFYIGTIQGGKIELSDKYENLYNITKEKGVQFGFILTPKITENVYVGAGTGWNSISNCSQIAIQLMYNIK